jgi:hypothetical protein
MQRAINTQDKSGHTVPNSCIMSQKMADLIMARDPIRIVRERRDQLDREINKQRAALQEMEAALRECTRILDEMLAGQRSQIDLDADATVEALIKPRELLIYGGNVPDIIMAALRELNRERPTGVESSILYALVRKALPDTKANTFRVAVRRLKKAGKIIREGKVFWLPKATAANVVQLGNTGIIRG